jgi:hypothetical protein
LRACRIADTSAAVFAISAFIAATAAMRAALAAIAALMAAMRACSTVTRSLVLTVLPATRSVTRVAACLVRPSISA